MTTKETRIKVMVTDEEMMSTFQVIRQLRPHLTEESYLEQVRRLQEKYGYQLVAVIQEEDVKAVSGFRIAESFAWNKHLYIEDLVTDENSRSQGYAKLLFDWLVRHAKQNECEQLHLESGVQRHGAHRFYLKNGMDITSYHFKMLLDK